MNIDSIYGDPRNRKYIKRQKEKIAWLIELGQVEFQDMHAEMKIEFLYNELLRQGKNFSLGRNSADNPVPLELLEKFANTVPAFKFRHFGNIETFINKILKRKADKDRLIEEFIDPFLQGLNSFTKRLRNYMNNDFSGSIRNIISRPDKVILFCDDKQRFKLDIKMSGTEDLGPHLLAKLLDGVDSNSLDICSSCNRIYFKVHHGRKYCSTRCMERESEKKQSSKKDYKKSRRMISKKSYLKNKLSPQEIIDKWRSEGVDEKWIKRLFPDHSS